MRPSSFLMALAAIIGVTANPFTSTKYAESANVHAYLDSLVPVALDVLAHQIGGPSIGADPGVVITLIPEEAHPEYNIYWLRDACLAYIAWIAELELFYEPNGTLRSLVDDSVHALIRSQHVVSIAGNIFTGGLEEALFDLHLAQITNNDLRIGSPAADGPPLRAVALIKYAEWLLRPEQNNGTWVADVLWPAINLDLQWISLHWNESSWDLWWAPVWGGSYWTSSVQYRALRAGARLSREIGREGDTIRYGSIASLILDYCQESRCLPRPRRNKLKYLTLQSFWNPEKGFMTETTVTNVSQGRSGIGSAPLTVSVLNFDPTLGCDSATFQPCSDRALSSLKVVGDAFKELFPINQVLPANQSSFFGFFLEDQLLGGQVQYFASFNVAEQIFDALLTWHLLGWLEVTDVSLKFFHEFDKDIRIGKYAKGSQTYEKLTIALQDWAENTILSLAERTPADLVIPLVMDKVTGQPTGPRGALRSQVAVLGAHNSYNNVIPPSWANGSRRGAPKKPGKKHDGCGLRPGSGEQIYFGF